MKIVRYAKIVILVVLAMNCTICFAPSSDVDSKKQNKLLTASLLVNEIRESIKNAGIEASVLHREMENNKKEHQDSQRSRSICKQTTTNYLHKRYEREVAHLLKELDTDKPESIGSWFDLHDRKNFLNPKQIVRENLNANFDSAFNTARSKVCKEQISRLIGDVYPTEEELEKSGRNQLRTALLERLIRKQKESIFTENRPLLSKNIIEPILNDAYKQKNEQSDIVRKSTGGNAIEPAEIQEFLVNELKQYQQNLRKLRAGKKSPSKVYDILPSVKTMIDKRARDLAGSKFLQSLSYPTFAISEESVYDLINSGLAAHAKTNESKLLCQESFRQDLRQQAITDHAGKVLVSKRAGFEKFLNQFLSENKNCARAFDMLIDRSTSPAFKKARQNISRKQFSEFFAPLANASWQLSDKKIDSYYFKKSSIEIADPFSVNGISSKHFKRNELLDETRVMVIDAEKNYINKSLYALREQMNSVEKVEPLVKVELKNFHPVPTINAMIELFTSKVNAKWSNMPLAGKHKKLFPRVHKDIEKRSKALLHRETTRRERIEKAKNDASKETQLSQELGKRQNQNRNDQTRDKNKPPSPPTLPGIGRGPGGKGGGTHDGKEVKEGTVTPEIIIDLDYGRGGVIANFTLVESELSQVEFVLSGQPDMDLATLSDIKRLLETWLKPEAPAVQEIHIDVLTRIFHRRVYYGVVFDLRECLKKAAIRLYTKNISIHWYDCLSEKKEKNKLYIPQELRNKSMPLNK